jgi:hypothetical protein
MDPNTALAEMIETAARLTNNPPEDRDGIAYEADRLAELVLALDGWIRKGGFLPDAWQKGR